MNRTHILIIVTCTLITVIGVFLYCKKRPEAAFEGLGIPKEVQKKTQQNIKIREELKAQNKQLFERMSKAFFTHDPIGINFQTNTDEYEPEVGTILPRLKDCQKESDLLGVIHEEFVRWFGADTAGTKDRYAAVTKDIWLIWLEAKQRAP